MKIWKTNTIKLAIGDSFHLLLFLVSGMSFIDFMKYEKALKLAVEINLIF